MKIDKKYMSFLATHKKKLILIGAILIVLTITIALVLPMFSGGPGAAEFEVGTVTLGSITETVDSFGTLEAQPSTTLVWNSSGVVAEFNLQVGDKVEKDDVLLELEPSSQATSILNAYTELLEAQNELDLLTATDSDYQDVLADLVYQEKMLINKQADKLAWNYGQSSMERVDAVRDNYYAARAEVWDLEDAYAEVKSLPEDDPARLEAYEALQAGILKRDSLERALNQILGIPFDIAVETDFIEYDQQVSTVAEARVAYQRYVNESDEISAAQALVQSLQNQVNKAKVITPFDGTVTEITAVAGDVVSSNEAAIRIDNLDNLIVDVDVSQEDINKIQVGQEAVLTFDAISKKQYTGFVQSISSSGEADEYGVVQFSVDIKVEDADEDVKPGFTVVVSIIVGEVEDSLLVPNDAISAQEDGSYAVTLIGDGNTLEIVPVEISAESDAYTAVVSDQIQEGDRVAIFTSDSSSETAGFGAMRGAGGGAFGGVFRTLR